ncbi:MAG: DUF6110 family protein [Eubacterium sp.]|nr:DUF6110 family protein [Eubacterium sp.]
MNWKNVRLVACGALLSTLGYRIATSRDAKKVYSFFTAAVIRERDYIMKGVDHLKENGGDILADAKARNEMLAAEKSAVIKDEAEETEA